MERVYAFTDEYGAFGWDINNKDVSTHFIITAIIVKESQLSEFNNQVESLRKMYFQSGEIKSKNVGKNHNRRKRIIDSLSNIPFSFFSVCIDKKKCLDNMNMKGLYFKKTFYKFMNNIVHKELRRAFNKITIIADEIGTNDYMQSFCQYVDKHQDLPNLFGDASFLFRNSKGDLGIQLADFISGTLSYVYDTNKKDYNAPDYYELLNNKMIRIEMYPKTFENYMLEESAIAEDYDIDIARLCFAQAAKFVEHNSESIDPDIKAQVIVLQYLLFRFMNNDTRGYIYTNEIKKQLYNTEYSSISDTTFRTKIIGKLRDNGIIIASSQKGYKIPSKESELYDYINHDAKIVIPMLERLRKCRDLVKLGTAGELDLLNHDEYRQLRQYFNTTIIED